MLHFVTLLYCLLLLYFVIILLACMTWVTTTFGEVLRRGGKMLGLSQCLENAYMKDRSISQKQFKSGLKTWLFVQA